MRNKHKSKVRRGTADREAIRERKGATKVRKSVGQARGNCVICGRKEADTFEDGMPVCSKHLHVAA